MDGNLTLIIIAAIAAIAPTILGIATLVQGIKTHATFNSKMDKLLKLTADSSYAEGKKDEADSHNRKSDQGV